MTQAPERILWAAAFSFGLAADLTEAMANGGQGKSPPVIKIRPAAGEPARAQGQPKASTRRGSVLCMAGCDDEDPQVVYSRKLTPLENSERKTQWNQMSQALWCHDAGGCTSHYGLPLWDTYWSYYYGPYAYPVYTYHRHRRWLD